jgi:translation initiation factor 2 beta subunit (eIF-2beta)/eIF-5
MIRDLLFKVDLEELAKREVSELCKRGNDWLDSAHYRDWKAKQLNQMTQFKFRSKDEFNFVVVDRVTNFCYYAKDYKEALEVCAQIVKDSKTNLDGKLTISRVVNTLRKYDEQYEWEKYDEQ